MRAKSSMVLMVVMRRFIPQPDRRMKCGSCGGLFGPPAPELRLPGGSPPCRVLPIVPDLLAFRYACSWFFVAPGGLPEFRWKPTGRGYLPLSW